MGRVGVGLGADVFGGTGDAGPDVALGPPSGDRGGHVGGLLLDEPEPVVVGALEAEVTALRRAALLLQLAGLGADALALAVRVLVGRRVHLADPAGAPRLAVLGRGAGGRALAVGDELAGDGALGAFRVGRRGRVAGVGAAVPRAAFALLVEAADPGGPLVAVVAQLLLGVGFGLLVNEDAVLADAAVLLDALAL